MLKSRRTGSATLWVIAVLLALVSRPGLTDEAAVKAQSLVDRAEVSFNNFLSDPEMTWFRSNVGNARGVLIVPKMVKAGFIIGGSGGAGVLLARDPSTGRWSDPAFYSMGAGSIGLQAGVEIAEVVLLIRTQNGIDAFLSTKFQLGAGASVAAGPVGAGAQAATADIVAYARGKGAYFGALVKGSVVVPNNDRNAAYYGPGVRASDVIVRREVANPGSASLIRTVETGAGS